MTKEPPCTKPTPTVRFGGPPRRGTEPTPRTGERIWPRHRNEWARCRVALRAFLKARQAHRKDPATVCGVRWQTVQHNTVVLVSVPWGSTTDFRTVVNAVLAGAMRA